MTTRSSRSRDRPEVDERVADRAAFRSPWWLPGAHAQTIVPALFARRARVDYRRERWDTPDGDFIVVDRTAAPAPDTRLPVPTAAAPTLVVFHGLEGSAESRYVRDLMALAAARGWHGIAPHYRGCGGTLNRGPRFYHSGDSDEIDWIVRRIADDAATGGRAGAALYAVGISLGGNMLLKWLGEQAGAAGALVTAAAAVSAPVRPGGRRHEPRSRLQSLLRLDVPAHAEGQEPRQARAAPRPLRPPADGSGPHPPRVRRCGDGADARLRRRRRLLATGFVETAARSHPRADADVERAERSVPAGIGAAARGRGVGRGDARAAGARRPCRLRRGRPRRQRLDAAPRDRLRRARGQRVA